MRLRSPAVILFVALLLPMAAFAATSIDNVRVYRAPEYTRFVFDVSEPPKYQVLPNVAPGRVVIDFREAALKAKLETVDLAESPVRRVRSGLQADGTTRVVLDLAVDVRVNSFTLPPNELYGHRLVVDLYDLTPAAAEDAAADGQPQSGGGSALEAPVNATSAAAPSALPSPAVAGLPPAATKPSPPVTQRPVAPAAGGASSAAVTPVNPATAVPSAPSTPSSTASATSAAASAAGAAIAPAPVITSPAAGAASSAGAPPAPPRPVAGSAATPPAARPVSYVEPRRVVVAIDAGHGGEDPGARGPKGTREKDVVLAIARAVRDRMKDEPGMKPVLIRDGDYYVGLKERRTRARKKYDADLFVSIHADAFTRREARGASVFAVSHRGASSTLAAYLADSENRADLIGGIDPRNDNDLVSVLSDMMREGTMRESLSLGRGVLDEMAGFARLHKRSVEQAGFMVLKEPNLPSILVETGFISNPEEERLLGTAAYQQRLAGAIVNGVRRYFENSAPPGTWFAARRAGHAVAMTPAEDPREESAPDPFMQLAQSGNASSAGAAGNNNAAVSSEPSRSRKPESASAARKAPSATFVKHKVGKGQSLGWLAKKYGVSKREIKDANNLDRDDIRIGETLKIPQK